MYWRGQVHSYLSALWQIANASQPKPFTEKQTVSLPPAAVPWLIGKPENTITLPGHQMVGTAEIMKLKVSECMKTVWEIEAGQPSWGKEGERWCSCDTHITYFLWCKTGFLLTYLCSEAGSYNDPSSSKPLSQAPELIHMYHHSKVLFYYLTFKKNNTLE